MNCELEATATDDRCFGAGRASQWPTVRAAHLAINPRCAACGTAKLLEVHHIKPFHLFPELELDPSNLITLCESPTHNDHLIWGHLLHWSAWNPNCWADAAVYRERLRVIRGRELRGEG